ncbi:MAG: hypothetical protein VX470_07470 [Planctomycetota bacterium]|nr:hypothetical protein [Planctomycetota bacterium]
MSKDRITLLIHLLSHPNRMLVSGGERLKMQELIQEFANFDETEFDGFAESASGNKHALGDNAAEPKAVEDKDGLEGQIVSVRELGPDMKRAGGWGLREGFDRRKPGSAQGVSAQGVPDSGQTADLKAVLKSARLNSAERSPESGPFFLDLNSSPWRFAEETKAPTHEGTHEETRQNLVQKGPVEERGPSPEVVADLRRQLQGMERTHLPRERRCVTSGFPALDQVLPQGGLEAGSLVEWLSQGPGSGTLPLALQMARQVCGERGLMVMVDRTHRLYPPALETWGFSLQRLLWVRPESVEDERWAVDQALRCPGVSAVWCSMGALDSRWLRRFQLAAETGGTLGLLERPRTVRGQPSWADLQIVSRPRPCLRATQERASHEWHARHVARHATRDLGNHYGDEEVWQLELEVTRGHGLARGFIWQVEMDLGQGNLKEYQIQKRSDKRQVGSQERQDGSQRSSTFDSTLRSSPAKHRAREVDDGKALPVRLVSQLAHPTPRRRSARA